MTVDRCGAIRPASAIRMSAVTMPPVPGARGQRPLEHDNVAVAEGQGGFRVRPPGRY